MTLVFDEKAAAAEHAEILEARTWQDQREKRERDHEARLKQMDIESAERIKRMEVDQAKQIRELELKNARLSSVTSERIRGTKAIFELLLKLPLLPFALLFAFILEMKHHDLPESLENFLDI